MDKTINQYLVLNEIDILVVDGGRAVEFLLGLCPSDRPTFPGLWNGAGLESGGSLGFESLFVHPGRGTTI